MIITLEKIITLNHEKIKVGVIEGHKVQQANFNYLIIDGKVKSIKQHKDLL